MSEQPDAAPATAAARPTTAGGMLRQARQAQGLHIAALAASIKVVPRKLELLESDQFDQLPDATFTRALAQAVCRTLKIDSAPVLALLPPLNGHRLEQVAEGLNTPFRERPGRLEPKDWASVASPVLWIAALIVVLTVAVYVVPAQWLPFSLGGVRPHVSADNAVAPGMPPTSETVVTPVANLASGADASAASASAPPAVVSATPEAASPEAAAASAESTAAVPDAVTTAAAAGVLQFKATAPSWVGVTDAHGQSLIGRLLQPGESVGVDGAMPMKVRIGNAAGTQVVFKGQPFAIRSYTRDNVARFDLK